MPRVIDVADDTVASLPECIDALATAGFDPHDDGSVQHAARLLRRLGNDPAFLGDLLVDELAAMADEDDGANSYGPQVIMLHPPGIDDFFIRANIWPSPDEYTMRASGSASFVYGLPHDHNFDFLTLGYFGPGYWSDYYEFDYESVAGWSGEPVDLRFVERARLDQGKIMLYRAHRDVHAQHPADALSVSINIMNASMAQGWMDQYAFDTDRRCISRIISSGSSEAFLRIAVGLGGAEALDLAHRFAAGHPSDRMRLCAWSALASIAGDPAQRDDMWRKAESSGSRLVAGEARRHRHAIAA